MFCGSVCREINHGFSNPLSVENELYQKNIKECELYDYVNTRKQTKEGFRGEFKVSVSLVELNCSFHSNSLVAIFPFQIQRSWFSKIKILVEIHSAYLGLLLKCS